MSETVAPAAAPSLKYVVTVPGYGFKVGATLTADEVSGAKARGTLALFTVRTMKGA